MVNDKEEGWHYCPYCEHKSKQINDHFNHIELFHSDEPLIEITPKPVVIG